LRTLLIIIGQAIRLMALEKSHWKRVIGKESELCAPHPIYLALHSNAIQRQAAYRSLLSSHIEGQLLEAIRVNSNKGMAIGNEQFKQAIEAFTGRRMKDKKRVVHGIKATMPIILIIILKSITQFILYSNA
jgi:hypothetical protein